MSKGEQSRAAILEQAVDLASVVGLHGLSIGGLAVSSGFSKSGLFAHFGSKESLQLDTLKAAVARFTETVIRPALKAPRGIPRIRVLFERWLAWGSREGPTGGCLFVAASIELDDLGGPLREYLVEQQRAWQDLISRIAQRAVEVGDFREDLDCRQFAHDVQSLFLGFNYAQRLLHDADAEARTRAGFERLLRDAGRAA